MASKIMALVKRFLALFRRGRGKSEGSSGAPAAPAEIPHEKLRTLTCLSDVTDDDPLIAEIRGDLAGKSSVLELMWSYQSELEGEPDNDDPMFAKLAKLFECGITPDRVEGHHYGVTIGIRTGELKDVWADYGNLLGLLWSTSLGKVSPWSGKSFTPAGGGTYTGINHFNEIEESPLNVTSIMLLTFWLHLKDAPEKEKARYGYDKNGGNFIAGRAPSVYAATDREVFRLNYRASHLANLPPLRYLVDEIVEIADGLYLGQLLFATKRLFSEYDPALPDEEYGYGHFGYFLLMDERWRAEAGRLFPYIGVPRAKRPRLAPTPEKFTTFTFAEPVDGNCDDRLLAAVREDMNGKETILDLLRFYSDELRDDHSLDSPCFARLQELFNRGVAPRDIKGFLRGALVSFHSDRLLGVFDLNLLNMAWALARHFSPWTGKTLEDIDLARLSELTEGNETGELPTRWGTNTYSLRTTRRRIVGQAMKVAGIWTEDADNTEKRTFGYDLKGFFFIGRLGKSISPDNHGKEVYQFNYRWTALKTPPPDNYCLDEVVQIADGLYLGQLTYATNLLKKWDPEEDPASYDYRLFGYFLLMDEDWHKRRLKIGYDLDNT